jgi:hypothetical protein
MATDFVGRAIAQLDRVVGVLSLSEAPDRIPLWAHYADCHCGVCLEFDVKAAGFPRLSPVSYANDCPDYAEVVEVLGLHQWSQTRPGLLADVAYQAASHKLPRNAVFYWTGQWLYAKSTDWSYEREWRSVGIHPGFFQLPDDGLSAVIVGYATADADVALLHDAVRQRRGGAVPIYRATRKQGAFGLDIGRSD